MLEMETRGSSHINKADFQGSVVRRRVKPRGNAAAKTIKSERWLVLLFIEELAKTDQLPGQDRTLHENQSVPNYTGLRSGMESQV